MFHIHSQHFTFEWKLLVIISSSLDWEKRSTNTQPAKISRIGIPSLSYLNTHPSLTVSAASSYDKSLCLGIRKCPYLTCNAMVRCSHTENSRVTRTLHVYRIHLSQSERRGSVTWYPCKTQGNPLLLSPPET